MESGLCVWLNKRENEDDSHQLKTNFRFHLERAKVYHAMGENELAIADYEHVLEISSDPLQRQQAESSIEQIRGNP